jgi:hypothetical protein
MIWHRLGALFVGLAFFFATTEALGHHQCPFHDGIVVHTDAMAGMHHHMPAPGHTHQCTCLGTSCCTAAITVPLDRLVSLPVVPVRVVRTTAVVRVSDEPVASHEDVLLPPPIGPPESLPV